MGNTSTVAIVKDEKLKVPETGLKEPVVENYRCEEKVDPEPKPEVKEESKVETKPEPKPEVKEESKVETKPEPKPEPKLEPKPEPESEPKEFKPEVKDSKPDNKPTPQNNGWFRYFWGSKPQVDHPTAPAQSLVPSEPKPAEPTPTDIPAIQPAETKPSAPVPEIVQSVFELPEPKPELKPEPKPAPVSEAKESKPEPKPEPVPAPKPEPVPAPKPVPIVPANLTKLCCRCQRPFEVPLSHQANNLCGRSDCFNGPNSRRKCRYCAREFVVMGPRDQRLHCNSDSCRKSHESKYTYQATDKFSVKAIAWLNRIAAEQGIHIHHAQNGGELKVYYTENGRRRYYLADGFCEETNTIYEFYGDYWHGNPALYGPNEMNPRANKTFGQLYAETLKRENIMRREHKVVTIWESDYDTALLDAIRDC